MATDKGRGEKEAETPEGEGKNYNVTKNWAKLPVALSMSLQIKRKIII